MTDLIVGIVTVVVGALLFLWNGKRERAKGRNEVIDEIKDADKQEAQNVKEKLDAISTDGDALERLRKHGKLRD